MQLLCTTCWSVKFEIIRGFFIFLFYFFKWVQLIVFVFKREIVSLSPKQTNKQIWFHTSLLCLGRWPTLIFHFPPIFLPFMVTNKKQKALVPSPHVDRFVLSSLRPVLSAAVLRCVWFFWLWETTTPFFLIYGFSFSNEFFHFTVGHCASNKESKQTIWSHRSVMYFHCRNEWDSWLDCAIWWIRGFSLRCRNCYHISHLQSSEEKM